jgi:hypothetical protein
VDSARRVRSKLGLCLAGGWDGNRIRWLQTQIRRRISWVEMCCSVSFPSISFGLSFSTNPETHPSRYPTSGNTHQINMSLDLNRLPFELILSIIDTLYIPPSSSAPRSHTRRRENIKALRALSLVNRAIGRAAQRVLFRGYCETSGNLGCFAGALSRNAHLADAVREVQLIECPQTWDIGMDARENANNMKESYRVLETILQKVPKFQPEWLWSIRGKLALSVRNPLAETQHRFGSSE